MSIVYTQKLDADSEVSVVLDQGGNENPFRIAPEFFMWGYKLYGSGYNLLEETDISCL